MFSFYIRRRSHSNTNNSTVYTFFCNIKQSDDIVENYFPFQNEFVFAFKDTTTTETTMLMMIANECNKYFNNSTKKYSLTKLALTHAIKLRKISSSRYMQRSKEKNLIKYTQKICNEILLTPYPLYFLDPNVCICHMYFFIYMFYEFLVQRLNSSRW